MRALLISSALVAVCVATSAAAQDDCAALPQTETDSMASKALVPIAPEEAAPPSPLAPLAADSPWHARFAAAADMLLPALRSGDPRRWQPLFGGRWLGAAERAAVAAALDDRCGAFGALLAAPGPVRRRIFGWTVPASYSDSERAEIAARPEAEALVCWAAAGDGAIPWPQTAAEADNAAGRPYACVRIAYSVRGGTPQWRAFIAGD